MARMPNMESFDAYFRKADLDQDGRISGAEAVAFFQGANLPQHVLAKIWMHADQNRTGFLGRSEFYNALRLVTVAQSGRELTPDIVRAALFGPAASQIPAPQIMIPAAVAPPPVVQSAGFRGPHMQPSVGIGHPYVAPPANNHYVRSVAPQSISTPTPLQVASMGLSGPGAPAQRPPISSSSTEWPGSRIAGSPSVGSMTNVAAAQGFQSRGSTALPSKQDGFGQAGSALQGRSVPSKTSQDNLGPSFQAPLIDGKGPAVSGNNFSSDSIFGGDVFSATPSQPKQTVVSQQLYSVNNVSASTALVPISVAASSTSTNQNQMDKPQSTSIVPVSTSSDRPGLGVGGAASALGGNAQLPWPRMTQSDIQRYTKVFTEVDTDRDGKITGEQARDLFLSWRLPREVLKQVWDLSDQDGDSMLSLKEFCAALYLMERYREGRPLPSVMPSSFQFDEALQPVSEVQIAATQRSAGFNGMPWQHNPGLQQHAISATQPGFQNVVPGSMSVQSQALQSDGVRAAQSMQQKSRVPVLELNLVNQLSRDEQNTLKSKHKEAEEAEKKVEELDKDIMDSKEKIDYYRSKLQELVLYKTRCDNRINEITERASADKREVESLSKRYEEKLKQSGESNSRLSTEEAAFRDLQERKMELYNAIVRMEQGGNADSLLQVRADRIQTDLEELRKALHERCKHLGLRTKPTALIELPYGWQPGIQENAADWDDDWDKFEDEGFLVVQDLLNEGAATNFPAKTNSALTWDDNSPLEEGFDFSSSANMDRKVENPSSTGHPLTGSGSSYAHSEDGSVKSGHGSPRSRSGAGSPPREISSSVFGKSNLGDSTVSVKETQSNEHGATSSNSGDAFGDGGSFEAAFTEANDDSESIWGFHKNPLGTKGSSDIASSMTIDGGREKNLDNQLFDSGDSPHFSSLRISSPTGGSEQGGNEHYDTFGPLRTREKSLFSFSDNNSVPGTPLFNTSSPSRLSNAGSMDDHSSGFDSFAKFDSFNVRDSGGLFGSRDTFARFDSISSTRDAGHSRGFTSFDDVDPFASAGPFSLGGQTPRHTSDGWSAF